MENKLIHLISVTYHNYGSMLQTYALQETVRKLGYSTEIVDYKECRAKKICRLLNKEYAETRFKMCIKKIRMIIKGAMFRNNLKTRAHAFTVFIINYFILGKTYTNLNDIKKESRNWDVALLGSDQVWHPINYEMHYFTLEYISDLTRKVAYAPSFGVSSIPVKYKKKYKRFLNDFSNLSCREISGVNIIREITGKDAMLVCDPTMLLTSEEWKRAFPIEELYKEQYLFVYLLGNNDNHRILAKRFAQKYSLKIVALTHIDEYVNSDNGYADYTPYNVGPAEFLSLINNSFAIITDSFHASVFSLLFHKKFFVFNRFESGVGTSTTNRIDTLLSMAGVVERKIPIGATLSDIDSIEETGWDIVDKNIEEFRNRSICYLKDVLDEN